MLMARVAARDGVAFRTIVDGHAQGLRRLAYRMLTDVQAAEDVAQEALLRLWDHAGRWRGDGPGIGAWLKRVTTNLCLDRLRRKKFVSNEDAPDIADESLSAADMMDEERMRTATINCIGTLPERQRAAIVLTYYEELSNAEAAAMLDMNIKAFESLLLRGRTALRKAIEANGLLPDFVEGGVV